ncbi:MAG TPA: hypothetical protein PLE24_08180 [Chitinispirillaceae bacterium]|jgi:hypothetical protein|nr:hypothetical protein [Chitinispirillaceae bacterium]
MKKKISSKERLLLLLASRGDPNAFFTLISPFLKGIYYNEQLEGSSHDEIIEKLKSLSKTLLKKLKGSEPKDFEEWFRKNSGYQDISFDIEVESKTDAGQAQFLLEIQRYLLKNREKGSSGNRYGHERIPGKLVLRFAIVIFILVFLPGIFYFYLLSTNSRLKIEYSSQNRLLAFTIPFQAGEINSRAAVDTISAGIAVDSLATEEKTVSTGIDTVAEIPAERKVSKPKVKSRPPEPVTMPVSTPPASEISVQRADTMPEISNISADTISRNQ